MIIEESIPHEDLEADANLQTKFNYSVSNQPNCKKLICSGCMHHEAQNNDNELDLSLLYITK